MKARTISRAATVLVAAMTSGCVGVSMHSVYTVRVAVVESASARPAGGVPLSVGYDYDSYGWFHFFNVPEPAAARTDESGAAQLSMADFRYRILLKVGEQMTTLDQKLVREGGVVSVPPYSVTLKPG